MRITQRVAQQQRPQGCKEDRYDDDSCRGSQSLGIKHGMHLAQIQTLLRELAHAWTITDMPCLGKTSGGQTSILFVFFCLNYEHSKQAATYGTAASESSALGIFLYLFFFPAMLQ